MEEHRPSVLFMIKYINVYTINIYLYTGWPRKYLTPMPQAGKFVSSFVKYREDDIFRTFQSCFNQYVPKILEHFDKIQVIIFEYFSCFNFMVFSRFFHNIFRDSIRDFKF